MERATWLTKDDLPLYEVAVFADAQLPTESNCNLVRAFYTWVDCISRTNMNPFPKGRTSHLNILGVAPLLAQFARGPLLCIVISD